MAKSRPKQTVEGEEEKEKWLKEMGELTSSLPKIIKTAFSMVHLIYFFTAGPDEVKAWYSPSATNPHCPRYNPPTDFERIYLRRGMSFDELKSMGSSKRSRRSGVFPRLSKARQRLSTAKAEGCDLLQV